MRVSLPVTISSCLAVVLLTWWLSTCSRDFLTPPDAGKLAEIRQRATAMNPTSGGRGDALSPADPRQASSGPVPVVLPRHIQSKPKLDDYLDETRHGSDYLTGLARLLDSNGHPARALLCWERVLDSSQASHQQRAQAIKNIRRLRKSEPDWNSDPAEALPLTIRAGTGPTAATQLRPVLKDWAEIITELSAGILSVQTEVAEGEEDLGDGSEAPVALWITGTEAEGPSTEIFSFTMGDPETLQPRVGHEIHRIIRHHISRHSKLTAPPSISPERKAAEALHDDFTRLSWQKFGESLHAQP